MSNINFDKPCHIYFMGIGGISMSGFAHLLHDAGFTISGSDMKQSTITHGLEEKGIHINYSQIGENIHSDIDLVVYTAAIHPDNSEYIAAKALNIPMIDRAEMVGQVMKHYSNARNFRDPWKNNNYFYAITCIFRSRYGPNYICWWNIKSYQ